MTFWDFMQWVFESFWRFVGLVILLGVCTQGLAAMILAVRGLGSGE